MSEKHTQTPWRLRLWPGSLKKPAVYGPPALDGGDYAPICEADEADAKFIVRACNSRDALLEACMDMTSFLNGLHFGSCIDTEEKVNRIRAFEKAGRAAIAQAEKEG